MYVSKNGEKYGDLEESILACILIEPSLIEKLRVEEKHFRKYGYILTLFKEFYSKHKNLDINLMFSLVKKNSELALMETITYLLDIFVIPTRFEEYQNMLLDFYKQDKKEVWLKKKIYEKATKLYLGSITLEKFDSEIKAIREYADKTDWK